MPDASYRFGPFLADRTGYQVLRDGEALDLTPKLLDLLFHLLDHSATLVTKEALLEALWPDANVTENALAQAMSELRQGLGDDPGAPTFIKTVARRGYRFIAPVTRVDNAEHARLRTSADAADADAAGRTIAVMDFVNVTGDADSAWLAAGIAETVTGDLRALDHFRVVDRWRVMEAARRTGGSLEDVAADLRARLAVVGSHQRHGDRIRITARVVDVVSGEALADAKVDGPLDAIFALQDQVVTQFSSELGVPDARSGRAGSGRETPSLDAFRAISEGWVRLESLDVSAFERALELYPHHAPTHLGLALAHRAAGSTAAADRAIARAEAALTTLIRTRPIEAAIVRAQLLAMRGDVEGALGVLGRLLREAPPGFAAWALPADPLMAQLKESQGFTGILGQLSGRAR